MAAVEHMVSDGLHMSSHALALGLAVLAYAAARRFAHDPRFAFGTWKIEVLGGYTSAVLLVGFAAVMAVQSIERLLAPVPIHYDQAIAVAALGLLVNLVSAWLLRESGRVLLDAEMDAPVVAEVRGVVAALPVAAAIADLHVWRVGKHKYACILSLDTPHDLRPETVRRALAVHEELVHVTVEIERVAPVPASAAAS